MVIDSERKFLEDCRVVGIHRLGKYFELKFESEHIADVIQPGQFVNIKLKTSFFRRPFTLFEKGVGYFSILVKVVGRGTEELSRMEIGQSLNVLGPLGNSVLDFGIHLEEAVDLVCGGVGIANMLMVAKLLKTLNKRVRLFWGIKSAEEYFEKCFEYVDEVFISSEDGKIGEKGVVVNLLEKRYSGNMVYASGPLPMIVSISKAQGIILNRVICSLEAVMGCGLGICYGCAVGTSESGYKLVCKDGPNFILSEVVKLLHAHF
ncbi:MAG: FAD-binding oxidoreductase [Brevinematia bacterium]